MMGDCDMEDERAVGYIHRIELLKAGTEMYQEYPLKTEIYLIS